MDHKVSKDMISSGMIPSGEKTQADLSRTQYGSAPSPSKLMDAYKSMYDKKEEVINEHHKKDADGNTIPHEDEELNEGKIPAGLQAYLDKKKGKKEDKKEVKEEMDLFDVISTHFINEGYEEKDVYKVMSSLTKDQLQNLDEAIPVIGAALAAIPAIAGKLAAGAAGLAKGGMAAAKGLGAVTKGVVSAAKGGASSLKAGMKGVASAAKGAVKAPPKITSSGGNVVQGSSNTGGNKIMDFAKRETGNKVRQELMKDRQVSGTNKTGMASAKTTDIAASADLFDIVKGQLLDEGLSEEEIKDIMLTLTPDEILKEMEDKPMEINVADAKANTPAYQNYMKGMKSKVTGKPMYKASQDMKDRAKGIKKDPPM